jgi:hypothetical protein
MVFLEFSLGTERLLGDLTPSAETPTHVYLCQSLFIPVTNKGERIDFGSWFQRLQSMTLGSTVSGL